MIDIGRQVESVGKKHLENEKSCLEDWKQETKVDRKKKWVYFFKNGHFMWQWFWLCCDPGIGGRRFFSLKIYIHVIGSEHTSFSLTSPDLFIYLALRLPDSFELQLPLLTLSEYETSSFLTMWAILLTYSLVYTYTFSWFCILMKPWLIWWHKHVL